MVAWNDLRGMKVLRNGQICKHLKIIWEIDLLGLLLYRGYKCLSSMFSYTHETNKKKKKQSQ